MEKTIEKEIDELANVKSWRNLAFRRDGYSLAANRTFPTVDEAAKHAAARRAMAKDLLRWPDGKITEATDWTHTIQIPAGE